MKSLILILSFFAAISSAQAQQADLVMTVGGDINFTKHLWAPNAQGVGAGAQTMTLQKYTAGLISLLQGADVNFGNIETVLTDVSLSPVEKTFNFQTHPNALKHLLDLGFNLFSAANNHAHDYGLKGIEQTLSFFRQYERSHNMAFSGVGANLDDATTPSFFTVRGVRIGFLAFGNNDFYPTQRSAGVLSYNNETHLQMGLKKLREADVDLRFVSIHTGTERMVDLNEGQRAKFNRILRDGNVNIIIGHHPHVVRPIEVIDGRVIFYSLGNYLMTGSANITRSGIPVDYGLMGKIFFRRNSKTGQFDIKAVQAIPLTNTHAQVQQMTPAEASKRVEFLNQLSRKNLGPQSMQFEILNPSGTGQWFNKP